MSFFNNEKKTIYFITKNFKKELQKKSDLILSPEFYWTKKVTLNIRYLHEASKMAPSVFDGILPNGDFKYKVLKLAAKKFIFIAYDMKNILRELKLLGIDMQMVDKIYTLQSEFINQDIVFRVSKEYGVATNEDIIVYVPLKLLKLSPKTNILDALKHKKLSGNYIYSKSLQKRSLNSKQSNQIVSLLIIIVLILLFDLLQTKKEQNLIAKQKKSLIKKYNLPQTSFQIKSLRNELSEIDIQQSNLNKAVRYIAGFDLSKNEFFNSLAYKKHILKFTVKLNNRNREIEFKTYISKKYKIIKTEKLKAGCMIKVEL